MMYYTYYYGKVVNVKSYVKFYYMIFSDINIEVIKEGNEFEDAKQRFPWIRAILEIKVESVTQTL